MDACGGEGEAEDQQLYSWRQQRLRWDCGSGQRATHDPAHPPQYLAAYDHGDHLHPNDAGHKAIANSIDLKIFKPDR
jgi:lysophospholipase L1-like esterase